MKQVTIIDVAKRAGVSKACVGRVIGNYGNVSQEKREKVLRAVKELDYIPNAMAQGLRSSTTRMIGVVVASIRNSLNNQVLTEVEKVCSLRGYDVIFCDSEETYGQELKHLSNLKQRRVDGIILLPSLLDVEKLKEEQIQLYRDVPLVMVDRMIRGLKADAVVSDNYQGQKIVTDKLLKLGHREIALFAYGSYSSIRERIKGHKDALRARKVEIRQELIRTIEKEAELKEEMFVRYLKIHPEVTACVLLNNSMLIPLLLAMRKLKRNPGQDLSLVTWDEDTVNQLLGIDTVCQDVRQLGSDAVETLFERIEGNDAADGRVIRIPVAYLRRGSCVPVESL